MVGDVQQTALRISVNALLGSREVTVRYVSKMILSKYINLSHTLIGITPSKEFELTANSLGAHIESTESSH